MNINTRIQSIIDQRYNANKSAFASAIGVGATVIQNIVGARQGKPSYDVIEKICANANISPEWLLTGNGDMLKSTAKHEPTSAPQRPTVTIYPAKHIDDGQQGIPLIPFSAMAGALRGEIQVCEYECEHYIVPEFKTANFLITINGDSMLPTYKSGDIVACQREAMTSVFFQWNRPYVLDTAQGAILKRIRPGSDKEHILIVSDNPAYIPFELPLSEIYSVALVVGFIRLE